MKTLPKFGSGAGFYVPAQRSNVATKTSVMIETCDASLIVSEDDNLLDVLLASGHEIDYQCRGGYCGSCRVKVSSGSVEYDDFPLAHIGSDEILPCCCRAATESLKLEVSLRQADCPQQGDLFDGNCLSKKK